MEQKLVNFKNEVSKKTQFNYRKVNLFEKVKKGNMSLLGPDVLDWITRFLMEEVEVPLFMALSNEAYSDFTGMIKSQTIMNTNYNPNMLSGIETLLTELSVTASTGYLENLTKLKELLENRDITDPNIISYITDVFDFAYKRGVATPLLKLAFNKGMLYNLVHGEIFLNYDYLLDLQTGNYDCKLLLQHLKALSTYYAELNYIIEIADAPGTAATALQEIKNILDLINKKKFPIMNTWAKLIEISKIPHSYIKVSRYHANGSYNLLGWNMLGAILPERIIEDPLLPGVHFSDRKKRSMNFETLEITSALDDLNKDYFDFINEYLRQSREVDEFLSRNSFINNENGTVNVQKISDIIKTNMRNIEKGFFIDYVEGISNVINSSIHNSRTLNSNDMWVVQNKMMVFMDSLVLNNMGKGIPTTRFNAIMEEMYKRLRRTNEFKVENDVFMNIIAQMTITKVHEDLISRGVQIDQNDPVISKLVTRYDYSTMMTLGEDFKRVIALLGTAYRVYSAIITSYNENLDRFENTYFVRDLIPEVQKDVKKLKDYYINTHDELHSYTSLGSATEYFRYDTLLTPNEYYTEVRLENQTYLDTFNIYIPMKEMWRNITPIKFLRFEDNKMKIARLYNTLLAISGGNIKDWIQKLKISEGSLEIMTRYKILEAMSENFSTNELPILFRVIQQRPMMTTDHAVIKYAKLMPIDHKIKVPLPGITRQDVQIRVKDFLDNLNISYELIHFYDKMDVLNFFGFDMTSDLKLFHKVSGIDIQAIIDEVEKTRKDGLTGRAVYISIADDIKIQFYWRQVDLKNVVNDYEQYKHFTKNNVYEKIRVGEFSFDNLPETQYLILLANDIKNQYDILNLSATSTQPIFQFLAPSNLLGVLEADTELFSVDLSLEENALSKLSDAFEVLGFSTLVNELKTSNPEVVVRNDKNENLTVNVTIAKNQKINTVKLENTIKALVDLIKDDDSKVDHLSMKKGKNSDETKNSSDIIKDKDDNITVPKSENDTKDDINDESQSK